MALTTVQSGLLGSDAQALSFRNRIINGDMRIDQRNAGASVTPATGQYTLDRWGAYCSAASKFTMQQNAGSVTPPVGFTKYVGVTSTSAYSIGASEIFGIAQTVEGYNLADLNWGSANASTVTLSFWVRSSLTGQFGGFLKNGGVTVGGSSNRFYQFSYTISSANTWEYKTVTIVGDTTGTWDSTNGPGLSVAFSLGAGSSITGGSAAWGSAFYNQPAGSTNLVSTAGATFYVTGVQLEKGTVATPFETRPYGMELALCQRYFTTLAAATQYLGAAAFSTNRVLSSVSYPATMRAAPTFSTGGITYWFTGGSANIASSVGAVGLATGTIYLDITASASAGQAGVVSFASVSTLSAEL